MRVKFSLIAWCMAGVVVLLISLKGFVQHVTKLDPLTRSIMTPASEEEIAAELAEEAETNRIIAGGEHYKPLKWLVEYPGVERPKMVELADSDFPASTPIVGIEVGGDQYAFVLSSMRNPKHHIANLLLGESPISVTYCDLADCVRVLTDETADRIPLKVGGLDIDDQMVFKFQDQRYGQSSEALPLTDFPFHRMTLGQWQERHPTSKLYVGPELADTQADS